MGVFKNNKEKAFTYIVFAVYLMLLCWLVLFKLATSLNMIPSMRGINVIPFYYDKEVSFHAREVIYNAIIFVPAGLYFSAILSSKSIWFGTVVSAILSLFFEVIQWLFSIGASDIITNTIGGLCGMIIFVILGKLASKHRMFIVNILGTIVEIIAVLFLILKIVLN